eukprot:CAMPEP_0198148396 /NCGR_PEP_ID=MMETSP1443-20131203/41178_1 /TAXON_ID=186043 /ORGANISM="Entomoneis sp., Strain CCMP2396" /LENGTH=224 /DNA_ID=CAMNT_0043813067 /DNA_START=179 /DNA_END=854 /DNA_ORIENTATION=-
MKSVLQWQPVLQDRATESFSYYLPREALPFSDVRLEQWFQRLLEAPDDSWSDSFYKGKKLLRKTAWCVFDLDCACEYGYSDTWQPQTQGFRSILQEITKEVESLVLGGTPGNSSLSFNCCNLNYYPAGGGVGFHADDESLFDGLNRPINIISLSLTKGVGHGSRLFQIRKSDASEGECSATEIMLHHGDLLTMEGAFQKHYHHAVWPGDEITKYVDHELAKVSV